MYPSMYLFILCPCLFDQVSRKFVKYLLVIEGYSLFASINGSDLCLAVFRYQQVDNRSWMPVYWSQSSAI